MSAEEIGDHLLSANKKFQNELKYIRLRDNLDYLLKFMF